MSTKPRVSIVMGSDSDLDIMRESAKALEEFGIEYEIDVTSAHRSPERTAEFARKAAGRGVRVIIAGRRRRGAPGGRDRRAHHAAGIGVPIPSTSLQGMDSLLATVQMPAGIPVATVAIGKPGRPMREFWRRRFWRSPASRWPRSSQPTKKSWPTAWKRNRES